MGFASDSRQGVNLQLTDRTYLTNSGSNVLHVAKHVGTCDTNDETEYIQTDVQRAAQGGLMPR
jgi:hypothetical protein